MARNPEFGLGSINDEMLPIAVCLGDLEGAIGGKSTALLDLLVDKFRVDIASDDREFAQRLADGHMPDEDDDEDEGDEADETQAASREAILDSMEEFKQRLLKGGPDEAMDFLDKNPAVTKSQKDALKDLMGMLGDALGPATRDLQEQLKDLGAGQVPPSGVQQFGFNLDDGGDEEEDAGAEGGEPPAAVSIAEILRCLIMGEEPAGSVPYHDMYNCALRYLALHFGEVLPHDLWEDFSSGAFREIDKAMRAAGVAGKVLSLDRLVHRGAPLATIPICRDGLAVGYLRAAEIEQALAALAAAKLDRMHEDDAVFMEDIRGWLRTCADSKRDLMCFSVH